MKRATIQHTLAMLGSVISIACMLAASASASSLPSAAPQVPSEDTNIAGFINTIEGEEGDNVAQTLLTAEYLIAHQADTEKVVKVVDYVRTHYPAIYLSIINGENTKSGTTAIAQASSIIKEKALVPQKTAGANEQNKAGAAESLSLPAMVGYVREEKTD